MTLVVEDGTQLTTAESYLSVVDWRTRATALGLDYLRTATMAADWITSTSNTLVEQALRRATQYLDGRYHDEWLGLRTSPEQALDWPRAGVPGEPTGGALGALAGTYALGFYPRASYSLMRRTRRYGSVLTGISLGALGPDNVVPERLKAALVHVAAREIANPGAMLPDYVPSEQVTSETVGPISVTYRSGAIAGGAPRVGQIDDLLAPLVRIGAGSVVPIARA